MVIYQPKSVNREMKNAFILFYSVSRLNKVHLFQVGMQRAHSKKRLIIKLSQNKFCTPTPMALAQNKFCTPMALSQNKFGTKTSLCKITDAFQICTSFNRETLYLIPLTWNRAKTPLQVMFADIKIFSRLKI